MKRQRGRIERFCAGCGKVVKAHGHVQAGELYCSKGCAEASRTASMWRTWPFAQLARLSDVPHHD